MIVLSCWTCRTSAPSFTGISWPKCTRIWASLAVAIIAMVTGGCGEAEPGPMMPVPVPPDSNLETGVGSWESFPSLKVPIGRFAAAAYRGTIFVAGGAGPRGIQDAVYYFNWELNTWDSLNAFPVRLHSHHMVVLFDTLFVVGGQFSGPVNYNRSLWAYDPATDMWETRPPMPSARGRSIAAAAGGRLLVVGGVDSSGGDMLVYDPGRSVWTRELGPDVRIEPGLVNVGGIPYAIGGRRSETNPTDPDAIIYGFDPGSDAWSRVARHPRPLHGPATAVLDGRIHFLGGDRLFYQRQDLHLAWEPTTDSWFEYPPLPIPSMLGQALALDGALYWIGGLPDGNWSASVYRFVPG